MGGGGAAACRDFSPQKICKSSNYCEAFLEERGEGIILGMGEGGVVLVILYREVGGLVLFWGYDKNNTWTIRDLRVVCGDERRSLSLSVHVKMQNSGGVTTTCHVLAWKTRRSTSPSPCVHISFELMWSTWFYIKK